MSVLMSGRTIGPTTLEIRHDPSGSVLKTAAPKDNGGDGSNFSPTDLCAVSLGACGATIMKMFATAKGIPVEGISFLVEKHMGTAPRKIARVVVTYRISTSCGDGDFARVVAAGRSCPVRLTLGDNVLIEETYERAPAVSS